MGHEEGDGALVDFAFKLLTSKDRIVRQEAGHNLKRIVKNQGSALDREKYLCG